jgi:predicted SprT family Zn-dependent metalloprotease
MTIDECGEYTLELLKKYIPNSYHEWEVEFPTSHQWGGKCWQYRRIIQINELILKYCTLNQIQDVVKHEVAHAVAYTLDNNCFDHGKLWLSVCSQIGCSGEISMEVDFTRSPMEAYEMEYSLFRKILAIELYQGNLDFEVDIVPSITN